MVTQLADCHYLYDRLNLLQTLLFVPRLRGCTHDLSTRMSAHEPTGWSFVHGPLSITGSRTTILRNHTIEKETA